MKANLFKNQNGSVLITALMTITIMTMICATSLYIASQNTGSGMQTAGWQQALTAAESGIDAGMRALNATASASPSPWASWKVIPYSSPATSYTLPSAEPTATATPSATATPDSSHYNYLPSSACTLNLGNTEGATSASAWVTVDPVGTNLNSTTSGQWYRIRSTGKTIYPTNSTLLSRVSNNRLDDDLRNTIAMHFNRKGGSYTGPTRTIEVIASPVGGGTSIWGQGILLQNALSMSGGGTIDHFSSSTTPTATFLTSPSIYRSTDNTETLIGMDNANGSDLKSTYVYGAISYSTTGAVPKNTTNVEGGLSTPFNESPPTTSNPAWTPDVSYGAGSPPFNSITPGASNNTVGNPYKVKVTGNFTVPGGQTLTINSPNNNNGNTTYLEIWITGSFTTSGSGIINQSPNVHVTYIVDGTVTTSGQSFNNQSGLPQNTQFVVVGAGDVTVSGSGTFVGTIEAPSSKITISGSGAVVGALIADTVNISGGASFHSDDSLKSYTGGTNTAPGGTVANYAFASWFEDNSDPTHKDTNGNYVIY
jgi:hypothetical protein